MAESFPSTIATNILSKIAFLSKKEKRPLWGIPEEITELQKTLSKIKVNLLNAEKKQAQNGVLQEYLKQLSDQLYDAEDVVDEVECELGKPSAKPKRFFPICSYIPLVKESRKLDDIIEKLDEIVAAVKLKCGDVWRDNLEEMMINHTCVGASEVFGRDGDKEKIINFLKQPKNEGEKVSVITIVGGGGIGKTTLAKLVYSDKMIDELFDLKMWVRVPEDFDIITLMKETCTSATGQNQAGLAVNVLEDRLLDQLGGKKFLLVLDDVWNENYDKWDKFKNLLTQKPNGSKIVVTTRSNQVAKVMGAVDKSVLEGLSREDSILLFEKSAAFTDEQSTDQELIEIRDGIWEKCGGNPLAVKTLGTLLHQSREPSIRSLIKENREWSQEQALKLSYAHLPSRLRRCLAYCSLFPKGYCFNSNYLVCHWMAHGFLATDNKKKESEAHGFLATDNKKKESEAHGFLATDNENKELEEVGLQYFNELSSRCFFQDVEDHGYFFTFQMHDFVHDLVLKVAQTECEAVDLRIQKIERNARHLSFLDIEDSGPEASISKKLRTIIMQGILSEHVTTAFLNAWISNFKYLRLLCFNCLQFEVLPVSIGALIHLRYLDLSWNLRLKEIPEHISKLLNLQTLILLGCSNLQKLSHNMQKMTSLRYLEITIKEIGEWIQSFTGLRTLVLQGCDSSNSLPYNIKDLKGLKKLVIHSCPKINLKKNMQGEDPN
ncbi:putative disease resistance protein RGA3 [Pistacia vera]|uniref:putative disease resistance protein RGA3 n=1 Tax=Pistacia vera TaxID=55513 RepID=UPI001262EACA|nr:putative disease resistance protein RGA3 [Pistacia vera]